MLVYAFRADTERHDDYRQWLSDVVAGDAAFGVAEQVLAGFVRVTTHPKVFRAPSRTEEAFAFADALLGQAACRVVKPSVAHWGLFARLCRVARAKGNLVTDAWFAALAIESDSTWVTTDRDFARFPGLRWRHPLESRDIVNPD